MKAVLPMKRLTLLAAILTLGMALSGCDKCGNFPPLFGSTSCGGNQPAKS
jgi:hypothetical protein